MIKFSLAFLFIGLLFNHAQAQQPDTSNRSSGSELITYVQQMPEFPGGQKELMKFLNENLAYPEEARKNGVEGKVISQFTVNADGSFSDIKILQRLGSGCDEEVLRLITLMPTWTPALQNGKPVAVVYKMPVVFKLGD
jgi:TonB family protein